MTTPKNGSVTVEDIDRAAKASVQSFPPLNTLGISVFVTERGELLPAFGTRECDRELRILYRANYNTLVQGAFTGLIKKVLSAPYIIDGPEKEVDYFNGILQNAQFGEGWKGFISRVLINYLTQNIGAFIEIIGGGEPDEPLSGPVLGLASLDSGRSYVTGQPEFPVIYRSMWTGRLHKMHRSRVLRLVDMPDGEESLYGYGMCALYRCASIIDREIKSGKYVSVQLDDRPNPGITLVRGLTDSKLEQVLASYQKKQTNDSPDAFGRTMWVTSLNMDAKLEFEPINFATPPEKYSLNDYTSLDVNALALALGVDKQELWELGGGSLGSGQQSVILAQKARGKAFGDMLVTLERAINLFILPESCEFRFDFKDDVQDSTRADIDTKYMTVAQQMAAIPGVFSAQQIQQYLSNNSEQFRKVLTEQTGSGVAIDTDQGVLAQPTLTKNPIQPKATADDSNNDTSIATPTATPAPNPFAFGNKAIKRLKAFDALAILLQGVLEKLRENEAYKMDTLTRRAAVTIRMRDAAKVAYQDGRNRQLDQPALDMIERWLSTNRNAIRFYADQLDTPTANPDPRGMVALLKLIYNQGVSDQRRAVFQTALASHIGAAQSAADMGESGRKLVFITRLRNLLMVQGQAAFNDGVRDSGAYGVAGQTPDSQKAKIAFQAWMNSQEPFIQKFADEIFTTGLSPLQIEQRARLWANKSLNGAHDAGMMVYAAKRMFEFVLGNSILHCTDCLRLNGQVHSLQDWNQSGLMPQSSELACGGWECKCYLIPTVKPQRGNF